VPAPFGLKGAAWRLGLLGHVPTGGYDNKICVRAVDRQGKRQLNCIVKPKSLTANPTAHSSPSG
jgi:hypothetical protein